MKILFIVIIGLGIIYVVGFILAYFAQEKIIYPRQLSNNIDDCQENIVDKLVKYNDTTLYHEDVGDSDTVAVFYHGNGNIVCDMTFVMDILAQNNISYVFPEYAGYNDNEHKTTHEDILQNVRDTVDYVNTQNYEHVYVIGQSIGSGAAAYHVSLQSPERLLLITPFTTLTRVIDEMIPIYPRVLIEKYVKDYFDNIGRLKDFDGKLILVHGTDDPVIRHTQSTDLFEEVSTKDKKLIIADGYGHEEISQSEEMKSAVVELVK